MPIPPLSRSPSRGPIPSMTICRPLALYYCACSVEVNERRTRHAVCGFHQQTTQRLKSILNKLLKCSHSDTNKRFLFRLQTKRFGPLPRMNCSNAQRETESILRKVETEHLRSRQPRRGIGRDPFIPFPFKSRDGNGDTLDIHPTPDYSMPDKQSKVQIGFSSVVQISFNSDFLGFVGLVLKQNCLISARNLCECVSSRHHFGA